MYSINSKTITKVTKQRVIVNNSTKETKWNHKNYSITPEEERQRSFHKDKGVNSLGEHNNLFSLRLNLKPSNVEMEGNLLNLIKSIYEKFTADIILNGERRIFFPQGSETRQRSLLS